jgi:hypothetical protein
MNADIWLVGYLRSDRRYIGRANQNSPRRTVATPLPLMTTCSQAFFRRLLERIHVLAFVCRLDEQAAYPARGKITKPNQRSTAIRTRESRQADATLDGYGSRGIDQTGLGDMSGVRLFSWCLATPL